MCIVLFIKKAQCPHKLCKSLLCMECIFSHGTSEHGVSKPICQKNFQSSPPKPFMGRLKLFKNAFKPTIAGDVTSFKNYPGWILGYLEIIKISVKILFLTYVHNGWLHLDNTSTCIDYPVEICKITDYLWIRVAEPKWSLNRLK